MKDIKKSIASMGFLCVSSLVLLFVLIPNYIPNRASVSANIDFTCRSWPMFLGVVILFMSIIGLIKYVKAFKVEELRMKEAGETYVSTFRKVSFIRTAAVMGTTILYGVLFSNFGTIISSCVCLPILYVLNGGKKVHEFLIIGGFCGAMYLVFKYILLIPLP